MLSYEQIKAVEKTLGPQASVPVLELFQALDRRIDEQKQEVKRDLLVELATKADIQELRGSTRVAIQELRTEFQELRTEFQGLRTEFQGLRAEFQELKGTVRADVEQLRGEIKKLEMLIKVLIGLAIVGMTLFSPNAAELLKLLK